MGWRLLRADLTKEGAACDWTPVDEAFQVMHQLGGRLLDFDGTPWHPSANRQRQGRPLPTTRDNVSCSRTATTKGEMGGGWIVGSWTIVFDRIGNSTSPPSSPGPVTTNKGWDLQTLSCLLTPLSSEGMEANE